MYLDVKNTIVSDDLFIVPNIRIDCQMDAVEFEGFFYKMLSESSFRDQRIHTKISYNDFMDWTITDYLSHFSD